MANKIGVIGDDVTVIGFDLAGLKNTYEAQQPKEAESVLETLISSEEYGLVLCIEEYYQGFSEPMKKKIKNLTRPVVVPIPGKKGPLSLEKTDAIREAVKKALGVDVLKTKTK